VILDSSVVPKLRQHPTLGGAYPEGTRGAVTPITRPELRGALANPKSNMKGMPDALDDLEVIALKPRATTKEAVRADQHRQRDEGNTGGTPPKKLRGGFGDGYIGGVALDHRIPLVTADKKLHNAVLNLGGRSHYFNPPEHTTAITTYVQ
jgi:predicted nucleic acid-binding protein